MTALYEDEPARDAEAAVEAWVEMQQQQAAIDEAAEQVLTDVREYLVAIQTARVIGADGEVELTEALDGYIRDVLAGTDGMRVVVNAFYGAIWHGGRSVERETRARLIRLRDVPHDGIVAAMQEARP